MHAILDGAFLCHVAYVDDGQPFVIPTAYCRIGEEVYLHGHISNRLLKNMKVCQSLPGNGSTTSEACRAGNTFHFSKRDI